MKPKASGVASLAFSGMRWNYLGSLGTTVCSLVIGTVLARILGPGPYGEAIIASIIYGFINLFVDGGFSQALIQKKELSTLEIRRTFTWQVLIGLTSTALVFALAPVIARLFHDSAATPVIRAMSALMTIQGMGLVSAALLRREMRFRVIQYASLSSYLFSYLLLGIPLALAGAGVWSLVAAYLGQSTINMVILYATARHPAVPSFGLLPRSMSVFGGTIIANNVVNWGHANLDNLAASQLGATALGLYGRASNLAYQPCTGFANSLQSVLLSSAAKVQDRKELLGQVALSSMVVVLGILGPAYATFALLPHTVMVGLYGAKWIQAVPLMIPLALAMPMFGCISLLNPILCGMGRPVLEFWSQAISCAVAGVAYFTAVRWSLAAVAWALLAVMTLRFLLTVGITFASLNVSWLKIASAAARRVLFSAAFALVPWGCDHLMTLWGLSPGARLSVIFVLCVALLGACIWFASTVVFGAEAIDFLLRYGAHLPAAFCRQLRSALNRRRLGSVPV